MNENSDTTGAGGSPNPYLTTVAVLLVSIIAILAVLWQRERRQRLSFEIQAVAESRRAQGAIQALAQQLTLPLPAPVVRDELPVQTEIVGGQQRQVLQLGAAAGQSLGFAPGDLIRVSDQPPDTTPAAQQPPQ